VVVVVVGFVKTKSVDEVLRVVDYRYGLIKWLI